MDVRIFLVGRFTGKVVGVGISSSWSIENSLLETPTSTFNVSSGFGAEAVAGDLVIVQPKHDIAWWDINSPQPGKTLPFLYGVVDSFTDSALNVRGIQSLMAMDALFSHGYTDATTWVNDIVAGWLGDTPGWSASSVTWAPGTMPTDAFALAYSSPTNVPLDTQIVDVFTSNTIGLFGNAYSIDPLTDVITIPLVIESRAGVSRTFNTAPIGDAFYSQYIQPANVGVPNVINIVDFPGGLRNVWYLPIGASAVVGPSPTLPPNMALPISMTSYSYDTTSETDTRQTVAQANLVPSTYQHQIVVTLNKISYKWIFNLGKRFTIVRNGVAIESIFTSYSFDSANTAMVLNFGNISSSLSSVLN